MGSPFRAHKSGRADVVEGRLGAPGAPTPRASCSMKARCYMNELGGPVKQLASFYKVPPERIVAIHDELDIPFDTMRVKLGGGDNGHNGLRSMRSSLGTGDFHRVRVGIGRPPGRQDVADFVLSNYSSAEKKDPAVPGRHGRRRRRDADRRGPRADPAEVQLLTAPRTLSRGRRASPPTAGAAPSAGRRRGRRRAGRPGRRVEGEPRPRPADHLGEGLPAPGPGRRLAQVALDVRRDQVGLLRGPQARA